MEILKIKQSNKFSNRNKPLKIKLPSKLSQNQFKKSSMSVPSINNNMNINNMWNNKRKFNSTGRTKNITKEQLYVPKENILKILVKYYNKKEIDKTENIIHPFRNKIYNFQEKHHKTSKEIENLQKETKAFINRYRLSGLLSPKNNSFFLKLGITQNTINEFDYLGYKVHDIINKTNIFDKSLLLNRKYDNFVKYLNSSHNPELVNDSNYISKINDGLMKKKYTEIFEVKKANTHRKSNKNIIYDNNENNEEMKISRIQLSKNFNDINKTLKIINNNDYLNGNIKNIKKNIKKHESIQDVINNIKNTNKSLEELEKENIEKRNKIKKKIGYPLIKNKREKLENKYELVRDNNNSEKIYKSNSSENKNNLSFLSTSFPEKIVNRNIRKSAFYPMGKKNNGSLESQNSKYNDSLLGSLSVRSSIMKMNAFDSKKKLKHLKSKNYNNKILKYNLINNEEQNITKNNNNILLIEDSEKKKTKLENEIKNNLLQRLYNTLKYKSFYQNKKEISDYLKKYKGINSTEPNYEKGSKIYSMINKFLNQTSDYSLPDEINKIRNKTNVFDFKRTINFDSIKKLNNQIKNLIYDCAENILDLNTDIKNTTNIK